MKVCKRNRTEKFSDLEHKKGEIKLPFDKSFTNFLLRGNSNDILVFLTSVISWDFFNVNFLYGGPGKAA